MHRLSRTIAMSVAFSTAVVVVVFVEMEADAVVLTDTVPAVFTETAGVVVVDTGGVRLGLIMAALMAGVTAGAAVTVSVPLTYLIK